MYDKKKYLREYLVNEEPRIFNGFGYNPDLIPNYRDEIIDYFQKLGLETSRKSIEGKEFIEGIFRDKNNRLVSLRFFLKGCYRNVQIEGDPYIRDIRMFKTLYRETPYINL